jgi:hypothetical protein
MKCSKICCSTYVLTAEHVIEVIEELDRAGLVTQLALLVG